MAVPKKRFLRRVTIELLSDAISRVVEAKRRLRGAVEEREEGGRGLRRGLDRCWKCLVPHWNRKLVACNPFAGSVETNFLVIMVDAVCCSYELEVLCPGVRGSARNPDIKKDASESTLDLFLMTWFLLSTSFIRPYMSMKFTLSIYSSIFTF